MRNRLFTNFIWIGLLLVLFAKTSVAQQTYAPSLIGTAIDVQWGDTLVVCEGESVDFVNNDIATLHEWSFGGGAPSSGLPSLINTHTATFNTPGFFQGLYSSTVVFSRIFYIQVVPRVTITPTNQTICQSSGPVPVRLNGLNPQDSVVWSSPAVQPTSFPRIWAVNLPSAPGNYNYTVDIYRKVVVNSDTFRVCNQTLTTNFTVQSISSMAIGVPPLVCPNDPVTLNITPAGPVNAAVWATGLDFNTVVGTGPSVTVSTPIPRRYFVRVNHSSGCVLIQSVDVNFRPVTPTPSAIANQTFINIGDTLYLSNGTPTPLGAVWQFPAGGSNAGSGPNDSIVVPITTFSQEGWYRVRNTSNVGACPARPDSIYISVLPANVPPPINVDNQDTIVVCLNDSVYLRTFLAVPPYQWQFGAIAPNVMTPGPIVKVAFNTLGFHRVGEVEDGNSVQHRFDILVVAPPSPIAATVSSPICGGDTASLVINSAQPTDSIQWSPLVNRTARPDSVWVALPLGTNPPPFQAYRVSLREQHVFGGQVYYACPEVDTLRVFYDNTYTTRIDRVRSTRRVCNGGAAVVHAVTPFGPSPDSIIWYRDPLRMQRVGVGDSLLWPGLGQDTIVYMEAKGAGSCSVLDSMRIRVPAPLPGFGITTIPTKSCVGDTVIFNAVPVFGPVDYEWSIRPTFDTIIGTGATDTFVIHSNTPRYYVRRTVQASPQSCIIRMIDTLLNPPVASIPDVRANQTANIVTLRIGDTLVLENTNTTTYGTEWTGPAGLDEFVNNGPLDDSLHIRILSPLQEGNYIGVHRPWLANTCPSEPDTVYVEVLPALPLFATVSGSVFICPGESTTLRLNPTGGAGPYIVRWDASSPAFTNPIFSNPLIVSPTVTTTYYFRVEDILGASFDGNITVTVYPDAGLDAQIVGTETCFSQNNPLTLSATTTNIPNSDVSGYEWDSLPDFNTIIYTSSTRTDSTYTIPVNHNLPSGTYQYYVRLTDVNGCEFIDSVEFKIGQSFTPQPIVGDEVLCLEDDIDFEPPVDPDVTKWHWVLPNSDTLETRDLDIEPDSSDYLMGRWACVQEGPNICPDTVFLDLVLDTIRYNIIDGLRPRQVCYGGNVIINTRATLNPNVSPGGYEWEDAAGNSVGNGVTSITLTNLLVNDTIYLELTTDLGGCDYDADTLEIQVNRPGPPIPVLADTLLCPGDTVSINALPLGTTPTPITFFWKRPDGSVVNTPLPFYRGINPAMQSDSGTYRLWIRDGVGCYSDTTDIHIAVNQRPLNPTLNLSGLVRLCHNDTLELLGTSTGCDSVFWFNPRRSPRRVSDTGAGNHRLFIPTIDPIQDTGIWYLVCVDTMTTCRSRSAPVNIQLHPFVSTPGRFTTTTPICYGDTGVFNIGNPNFAYWYTDTTSGIPVAVQDSLVIPNLIQQTIAYVRIKDFGSLCFSEYIADTIEVLPAVPIPPDDTVVACYQDPLSYSISPVAGLTYQWDGPNGYSSSTNRLTLPIVDSSTVGIYTLVATDGICTSDTVRITVDFHPPNPLLIDSFAYVCFGDSLQFGVTNGPNCSSAQWYRGAPWWSPTFQAVGSQTQDSVLLIQGDSLYQRGVSYWYYECTDATTGCITRSDTIVAIIEDSLNRYTTGVQPDTICQGDAATLVIQTPRQWFYPIFYAYYWYADTTASPIDSGYTVTIPNITTDTTFYLIVRARLGGCTSNAIPTPVTINLPPPPDLRGDPVYCVGDTIRLTTPPQGPLIQYRWDSDASTWAGVLPIITTVNVTDSATALDAGTYTLQTRRLPNGCWSERDTLQIQVATPPTAPFLTGSPIVCDGDRIVLVADGSCAAYEWVGFDPLGIPIDTIITPDSLIIEDGDINYQPDILWQVRCISPQGCLSPPTVASGPTVLSALPTIDSIVIIDGPDICLGDTSIAIGYVSLVLTNGGKWYGDSSLTLSSRLSSTDTLILAVTQDTTVYYTVNSTATGCPLIEPVRFTINQLPPPPTILGDTILCEGDDLSLTVASSAFDHDWVGPNGYITDLPGFTVVDVDLTDGGIYTVSVADSFGCWSPDVNVSVIVNPTPIADITPLSQTVCEGETVLLDAIPPGATSYDWYSFDPTTNTGVFVDNGSPLIFNNIQYSDRGEYYVIVGQGNCFDTSGRARIQVDTPTLNYLAQAMADTALCGVDSVWLSATRNYPNSVQGTWFDVSGNILSTAGTQNALISGLNVGRQTFYWSLSVGACADYSIDTVVVDYVPLTGGIANVGSDLTLCNRTVLMLDANPDSLAGAWRQYSGPNTVGILQATDPNTLISGLQVGDYEFIWDLIHPVCGVYDSDTLLVEVIAPPNILADAGLDDYICNPDDLILAAVPPGDTSITGRWTTNSNAVIDEPDSLVTDVFGVPSGTTSFVWTLSTDDCRNYSSDTVVVWQATGTVVANPDVVFVNSNTPVVTNVINNDQLPPHWDIRLTSVPDAGQVFDLGNGTLEVDMNNVEQNQQVIYELCDTVCPMLCDTALVSIIVDASVLCAIPNIFTPNNDGVNDLFEIPCIPSIEAVRILIFNRWGDVVYETDQYQNNWDGTHRGEALPDGTYFYVLYRVDREPIQGSVEIKR